MVKAAIDVGSNSMLLTVVDGDRVLHDEVRIVGMAKGLGERGRMQPERRAHGFEVLVEYTRIARGLGAEAIRAAATSGARRAVDAPELFDEVFQACGLRVQTISGDEEARLSWAGSLFGLDLTWPVLLVDVGGGSTELVVGDAPDAMRWRSSRAYGAVRLQERFGDDLAGLRAAVAEDLRGLPLEATTVVAVAGTATMFGALSLDLKRWEADRVHGFCVSREQLQGWSQRFAAATPQQREAMAHLAPQRGPYLAGGALILDAVLDSVGAQELMLSNGGLRFGLLQG